MQEAYLQAVRVFRPLRPLVRKGQVSMGYGAEVGALQVVHQEIHEQGVTRSGGGC